MSLSNLNEEQLSEVLTVGITASMDTLASILGNTITTTCGDALTKKIAEADFEMLKPAMYYNIAFSGGIKGKAIAIFRKIDLAVILNFLMNNDGDSVEFDEMGLGMIKEIMTQIISEFAKKLSDFFGFEITCSVSGLMPFERDTLVCSAFDCEETDEILTQSFQFDIGSIMKGRSIFAFNNDFYSSISKLSNSTQHNESEMDYAHNNESQFQNGGKFSVNDDSVNIQPPVFPKFNESNQSDLNPLFNGNMNLLMDVPMNVCVEIGKAKKRMKDIMNFTQGTVIPIEKQAGAPVDITVNGQLIARGDVIVIDDNFGVRITELIGSRNFTEKNKN